MNNTSTRRPTAARHTSERTPHPVLSAVFCLAVFAGGLAGAQAWLTDVCPTTPELAQVCSAVQS